MKNLKNKKKKDFLDYYKTLEQSKRLEIRDRFLDEAGLSYPAWYVKICRGSFRCLELKLLSTICNENFYYGKERH